MIASFQVRCPFGCSEFLHKVNTAPLEDFLWAFSNYQMKSYGTAVQKTWTDCISPSFPSTCLILEKFECSPSLALTDDGMMILCCREHSKHTKESYLHVPESPEKTGSIFSPNGNAFAPVVIRSRNIRNFKVGTVDARVSVYMLVTILLLCVAHVFMWRVLLNVG